MTENNDKERRRKKQFKRMGKIVATAWEWEETFQDDAERGKGSVLCLIDLGEKVDSKAYRLGRHGWEDFARDLGGVYNRHVQGYVCVEFCLFAVDSDKWIRSHVGLFGSLMESAYSNRLNSPRRLFMCFFLSLFRSWYTETVKNPLPPRNAWTNSCRS